jgi:hypothetical protein
MRHIGQLTELLELWLIPDRKSSWLVGALLKAGSLLGHPINGQRSEHMYRNVAYQIQRDT